MIIPVSDTQRHGNLVSLNTAMPNCASIVAPELAIHPLSRLLVDEIKICGSTFAYVVSY